MKFSIRIGAKFWHGPLTIYAYFARCLQQHGDDKHRTTQCSYSVEDMLEKTEKMILHELDVSSFTPKKLYHSWTMDSNDCSILNKNKIASKHNKQD